MTRLFLLLVGGVCTLLPSAGWSAWTRSYVIEWIEPAMYYGAENGVIDPGTDCPAGTNPEIDWVEVLVKAGYSREEAEWLRNPANPTRSPVHGQNQMAFRGKDRANVYTTPTSYPDPGLVEVSGTTALGLDLDDNKKTGFISPAGEPGIDNTFYKTLGCWKTYRGPARLSSGALTFNDAMRNGSWTSVIVVQGQGDDPQNDPNVRVGIYMSDDDMVKGGDGNIAQDYTFRIAPHAEYEALYDAQTRDGVITSKQTEDVILRDPSYARRVEILRSKFRFEMREDGSLSGLLGGYRPWKPVYDGWVNARGPVIEALTWVELPGVYYALQRNADFSPEGPNGPKTHISFALAIDALPAFVVQPDASAQLQEIVSFKASAPQKPDVNPFSRFVVNGIVPDRSGRYQAGPTAQILPDQGAGSD